MLQFHMHTGSEHFVHGVQSDLAIHFVHQAGDGEYSVVGVLCDVGTVEDAQVNTFWQSLTDSINDLEADYNVNVNDLLDAMNTKK